MKITVFGISGTGKTSVCEILADKLDLSKHSSGDFFRAKAEELGLELHEFEKLCNEDPKHDKHVDEMQKKFGEENERFIIDGRLSWHFIPDSLKIKLHCDDEVRYERIGDRDGHGFEKSMELTKTRDKKDLARYEEYYGIENYGHDEHFDIVVDTSKISIEEVVAEILDGIEKLN